MMAGVVAGQARLLPAAALWTPTNMAVVPQVYIDAQDSVVTDVSGFASAIGNLGAMGADGDFLQATAGNRPAIVSAELNGCRVLRFDGTDDYMTAGTSAARAVFKNVSAAWIFVVYKKRTLDASPTSRYIFYAPKNDSALRFGSLSGDGGAGGANKPYFFARRLDSDSAVPLNSPNVRQGSYCISISSIDFSTREGLIRENGTQAAFNATLTPTAGNTSNTASVSSPLSLGAYFTGSVASDIDIASVVIGNTHPSGADFERLEGWAAHKYALTSLLPPGHPYKTVAPTV